MKKTCLLAVLCGLEVVLVTAALAKAPHAKIATAADVRRPAPPAVSCGNGFICRQDLFDRNNRSNLRSDWPGPPAQPGQF